MKKEKWRQMYQSLHGMSMSIYTCLYVKGSFSQKKNSFFFLVTFADFGDGENISSDCKNKIHSLTICVWANFLATLIYFLS